MRHLLAKDLRLVAPYLWLILPAHALWCAQAFLTPELYTWMSLAAALAWTVAIATIEWHCEADRLVASLPVTRAAIVAARYVSALGGLAVGAALYQLYGYALLAVASDALIRRWHGAVGWAPADSLPIFLSVGYVLIVGFLPFLFRFGFTRGATLFSALAVVVASAATVLSGAAGSMGPDSGATGGGGLPSQVIGGWLSSLGAAWGRVPAALALVAGSAALGAWSMWLSVRFYKGRDL